MAMTRWQPWQEMETLRHQLDRMFDDLAPVSRDVLPATTRTWAPAIELKHTDAELVLRAELPGIDAKDLEIQVAPEAVLISGESKTETRTEKNRVFRSEFRYGSFRRVVSLPVAVRNDQVKAEFDNGILTLTLPKVEAPKVVKVNLTGATAEPTLTGTEAPTVESPTAPNAAQPARDDVWAQ